MKKKFLAICALCLAGCSSHNDSVYVTRTFVGGGSGSEDSLQCISGCPLADCDRDALLRYCPRTVRKLDRGSQLDVQDIKSMYLAGLDESTIIGGIMCTDSKFHLTTSDIITLRNMHVPQKVIDSMLRSGY